MRKSCPRARGVPGHLLGRRGDVPPQRALDLRHRLRTEQPERRGRGLLPDELRPLRDASEPHGPGEYRPDQPLQPHLPDLLRQRQRHRVRLRAVARPGSGDAPGLPQRAPGGRQDRTVLRRRAHPAPAVPRRVAAGGEDGVLAHPGRLQRHLFRRPGVRDAGEGGGAPHHLPPVRRPRRRDLPGDAGATAPRRQDEGGGKHPPGRDEDRPRLHDRPRRQRRGGRRHPALRHRQRRRHRGDQLPAGLFHGAHLAPGADAEADHPPGRDDRPRAADRDRAPR